MSGSQKRILVLLAIMMIFFSAVVYKLVDLQVVQGAEYRESALNNRLKNVRVEPQRGDILDRNGEVLAASTMGESVAVFPAEVARGKYDVQQMATKLGHILDMEPEQVLDRLTADSNFVWLKRKIPFRLGPEIEALGYPGVVMFQESQRYYPKGRLASQTIGFAGMDNQGLAGLEVTYEQELTGIPGEIQLEVDSLARVIPESVHNYTPPVQGNSLVLSLDARLQHAAERYAEELLLETGSESVSIVVMDPRNGEILALTGKPDFAPAEYGDYPQANWRNYAIQNFYEPGSTFKVISAASALEAGVTTPATTFMDKGFVHVEGVRIRSWRWYNPHGEQTFTQAFANSSNPVFVQAAMRMQEKQRGALFDYYRAFGFGQQTGLRFTSQAAGLMPAGERDLYAATSAIGQGIAVTPIQLITAVSTAVNGGLKVEPVLVRDILDEQGNRIGGETGWTGQRVVSEETSRQVREMLETAVQSGTGRLGKVAGYRVGGKTGTAQKPSEHGGYMTDKYITSFVGVAPIDDPRVVVLVVADSPDVDNASGGQITGPTVSKMLAEALERIGLDPDYDEILGASTQKPAGSSVVEVRVPNFIGSTLETAAEVMGQKGFSLSIEGEGELVMGQSPRRDERVPFGTTVTLTMGQGPEDKDQVMVPDVLGMRATQAAPLLERSGLLLSLSGSGTITEQYPEAGTFAQKGSAVIAMGEHH